VPTHTPQIRRAEQDRLRKMDREDKQHAELKELEDKLKVRQQAAEERTVKNRNKRQKKKVRVCVRVRVYVCVVVRVVCGRAFVCGARRGRLPKYRDWGMALG